MAFMLQSYRPPHRKKAGQDSSGVMLNLPPPPRWGRDGVGVTLRTATRAISSPRCRQYPMFENHNVQFCGPRRPPTLTRPHLKKGGGDSSGVRLNFFRSESKRPPAGGAGDRFVGPRGSMIRL